MKYYIEAYGDDGKQILGNLDGQGVIISPHYQRANAYKRLKNSPRSNLSLNGRVAEYRIVTEMGIVKESICK